MLAESEKYDVVPPRTSVTVPNGVLTVSSPSEPTTNAGLANDRPLQRGGARAAALGRNTRNQLMNERLHALIVFIKDANDFLHRDRMHVGHSFQPHVPIGY